MRNRAVATPPPMPAVPLAPPSDIEDILAKLEQRTKAASPKIPAERGRVRIRPRPRRILLVAALPVLALGVAWAIDNAVSPEPPAAPVLQPNVAVSITNTPANAALRQSLHGPLLRVQPKTALEQARALFPADGKSIAFKFKPVSELKFREPESYIVMFTIPARQDLLDDWKSHGIVLIENYGPLVSVFWAPSEAALKTMGESAVQVCPLSMAANPAPSKMVAQGESSAKK